jgi:ribokinase
VSGGPLVVLGAINVDLVVTGLTLPKPGRTVVGGTFAQHHGGKGGNQAVAAARAGAQVAMLGAVGADAFGDAALEALQDDGVDVARVRRVEDRATGVALIVVDRRGENQISVAPGANAAVAEVVEELEALRPAAVLASCEIRYPIVSGAARWCGEHETPFVLNPAPASPRLRNLLDQTTVVTPNAQEVTELSPGTRNAREAARRLAERFAGLAVAVTLGEDGALLLQGGREEILDAPAVEVVDTTGAGDCFSGVVAAALWEGRSVAEAVRRGVAAAASSVTVAGAREGMPARAAIDAAVS